MKFCVAAILALSAAPAHSFSYLDQLGSAPVATAAHVAHPVAAAPAAPAEEAPFFFTNGATDEPADSPAFFFTSGSTDVHAHSSGSYLDALGGASSAVAPSSSADYSGTAGSSSSYLNVLGSGATVVSGPGVTTYLDALPQNSAVGGAGINTYASSLNQHASEIIGSVAPSAPAVAAPAPVAAAPAAPVSNVGSFAMATSAGSYLDALSTAASTMSGAGIHTYVESLPITAALAGGSGINTYASNLVSSTSASGPGVATYIDTLGGGIASFTNSFSPFSGASISASGSDVTFTMGSVTGQFDFTLEASAEMVDQLKAAGSNSVTITGKFYN